MRWKLGCALSAITVGAVTIGVPLVSSPTDPAGAAGNRYGTWVVSAAGPVWTGTMVVGATGFPGATVATDSASVTTPAPVSGGDGNTLSASVDAAGTRSTTTLAFASATPPAGWGFALGDVDTDSVQVVAVGPGGVLTEAQLGFQGGFNACTDGSPRPAACPDTAPTDVPRWDASAATLRGNGADTAGASGWFTPTVPITSMTLTYTAGSSATGFQLSFAADTSDISGTVRLETGGPAPVGSRVRLLTIDDIEIAVAPTGADGTFRFLAVPSTVYAVELLPPAGAAVVGAAVRPADATAGDVLGIDFLVGR